MDEINKHLHFIANDLYINSYYKSAIDFYNLIIGYNKQYIIYSNIAACYLKEKNYIKALEYGLKSVQDNNKYDIGWGRIGSAYKGLNKYNDSITSYKLAYALNRKKIYEKEIIFLQNKINKKITKKNIFDILLKNNDILNKLGNIEFRKSILEIRNYEDIFNNENIVKVINDIIDKL